MKTLRFAVLLLISLGILPSLALQGAEDKKQPVLVLLYSRFDDHVMAPIVEQRLFRLTNLIEKLRKDYPQAAFTVNCQFSGGVTHMLSQTPTGKDYVNRLQNLAKAGAVTFGYAGEPQAPYRDRPKPNLKDDMTAEQRWAEQVTFADRSMSEFRDFLTGKVDPARIGGVKAMRERFGDPAMMGLFTPQLGGEAPYFQVLQHWNLRPVVPGLPDPSFTLNIHGYRTAATDLAAKGMAPAPETSPEIFWDSGLLRASLTDAADIRGISGDEPLEPLQKFLKEMDRSHVRLLQVQVAGYSRYLAKWPDGTPKLLPLAWAYEHPDDPIIPSGVRAFATIQEVEKAYTDEEATLRWLLDQFVPATPGSRFISPRDLTSLAANPVGRDVDAVTLTAAAKDWIDRSAKEVNMSATWVKAGNAYFSAADLFQLLANSLASTARGGKRPETVRLTQVYGPIRLEQADETFPNAMIPIAEITRAAAELAPKLNDQGWRPVPSNAVPVRIDIAGKHLIPAQFLALMVEAYLAPADQTAIKLRYFQPPTAPGYFFPRQNTQPDAGHIWTLRPAPLALGGQL